MNDFGQRRVMWLLNHSAARKFEIAMLKRIGFREFFLPKIFPSRVNFRSASADFSEDANLTIPGAVLEKFNAIDWYSPQPRRIWEEASGYFDIAFFINDDSSASTALLKHFRGAAVWRTYGLDKSLTYTALVAHHAELEPAMVAARQRFWFGQAYPHLADVEASYLQRRSIYLPLGMPDVSVNDKWRGSDAKILFVCPDLGFNEYYQGIYADFKRKFGDLPYVVGGGQPVAVHDPHVLGYLSSEEYERNMRELRVMYYHSREPRHVHYHPFEAVRVGMPLIFMGGGLLDTLGGKGLPGRCATVAEARRKIERVLANDQKLIERVRDSQTVLLDAMKFENMVPIWEQGMRQILRDADYARSLPLPAAVRKKKRVAVLVPVKYRGGSLRGAKMLAEAIRLGSIKAGDEAEVVMGHVDDPEVYSKRDFADMCSAIKIRPFRWRHLDKSTAARAMEYAGAGGALDHEYYSVPDDGIQQFGDCDLWVVVSDRLELPLLPLRPAVLMVYDYLQRHLPVMKPGQDEVFLLSARRARRVLVTTEFTRGDAISYAGVPAERVVKLPMLAPEVKYHCNAESLHRRPYFVWSTNAAPHKNHTAALEALRRYYDDLGGELDCLVTGVNSRGLRDGSQENLRDAARILAASRSLRQRISVLGELQDAQYAAVLRGARFYWHPAIIDNGTFGVVEAARLGIPSLSSDYPAMREMDTQFGLNLAFFPCSDPVVMAERLRWMQDHAEERRALVPTAEALADNSIEQLSGAYWEAIRELM